MSGFTGSENEFADRTRFFDNEYQKNFTRRDRKDILLYGCNSYIGYKSILADVVGYQYIPRDYSENELIEQEFTGFEREWLEKYDRFNIVIGFQRREYKKKRIRKKRKKIIGVIIAVAICIPLTVFLIILCNT